MGKLVRLKGLSTKKEIAEARRANNPLFLGVPLAASRSGKICQLRCVFCFVRKRSKDALLSLEDHFSIINQFAQMGGRYIKTAHEGEPFLDENFYSLVDHANAQGLYWTSFSNLISVTPEVASNLYKRRISIIGKLHSLNPSIQETLCGDTGHYSIEKWTEHNGTLVPVGLKYLIDAGFNRTIREERVQYTRLGVDVVITNLNYAHVPEVVEFCIDNNIYPDIETLELSEIGRGVIRSLQLTKKESTWLFDRLRSILGDDFFEERRALTTDFCPLYQVGIVYDVDGRLRYCYVIPLDSDLTLKGGKLADIYPILLRLKNEREEHIRYLFLEHEGILNSCPNGQFL